MSHGPIGHRQGESQPQVDQESQILLPSGSWQRAHGVVGPFTAAINCCKSGEETIDRGLKLRAGHQVIFDRR